MSTNDWYVGDSLMGEFIRIWTWHTEGQVIAERHPLIGNDVVEVLLETTPDDSNPRWYRLEPQDYTVLS